VHYCLFSFLIFSLLATSSIIWIWRSGHFSKRYEPNCGKNAQSRSVEESFIKIPEWRSGHGWLPKFNQFFFGRWCICGKFSRYL